MINRILFTDEYDIAIIKLKEPVKMTKYIKPICLSNKEPTEENDIVLISGWGRMSIDGPHSDVLMKGVVSMVSRKNCAAQYAKRNYTVTDLMICAASLGKDSCQGDSGGMYVQNIFYYLIFQMIIKTYYHMQRTCCY